MDRVQHLEWTRVRHFEWTGGPTNAKSKKQMGLNSQRNPEKYQLPTIALPRRPNITLIVAPRHILKCAPKDTPTSTLPRKVPQKVLAWTVGNQFEVEYFFKGASFEENHVI